MELHSKVIAAIVLPVKGCGNSLWHESGTLNQKPRSRFLPQYPTGPATCDGSKQPGLWGLRFGCLGRKMEVRKDSLGVAVPLSPQTWDAICIPTCACVRVSKSLSVCVFVYVCMNASMHARVYICR